MRKLSEDNAALQADNECKDSLIETLQAQLRQVEGQSKQQAEEAVIVFAKYTTLRQLVEAVLLADERGQGLPFKEAMEAAAKAINWNSLPPPTEERS